MTLLQLLKQIRGIESRLLTTEGIPLKMYNYDIDFELELQGENGDYWIDVKLIPDAKQFQQMLSERNDYYYYEDLDFSNTIDWQQVRIQAAVKITCALSEKMLGAGYSEKQIVKQAVKLSDALVEELKKGGN